ncbi:MAG: 3-methylornithyl-N6-L-lysine dehydrogenase PylD [Peptococcaceae bacterium]|jgi:pyrrolysine biosynthesis protein PylD|nr:3-methylornithyl-N6-L-lysine dehydrogenase PylD [Peptococcaceae bacterium]
MTRLKTEDIAHICTGVASYDREFSKQTGKSMLEAAQWAFHKRIDPGAWKIAVVPVNSGAGVLSGFCDSVAGVLRYVGCNVYITDGADVAGLSEAYLDRADIVFMADDDEFAACGLTFRGHSSNGSATGIGYAAGLELMRGDLDGQEVLVLGAGPVGCAATQYLLSKKARVFIHDPDPQRLNHVRQTTAGRCIPAPDWSQRTFTHILDATPAARILTPDHVTPDTLLALPGIPIGADEQVIRSCCDVLHNPLELGTIAMLVQCVPQH